MRRLLPGIGAVFDDPSTGRPTPMTVQTFPRRPEVALPTGSLLGEAPIWDWRSGTLLWVDIDGQLLWRWRPDAGEAPVSTKLGERVAFVKLTPDPDTVVVGLSSGIARLALPDGTPEFLLRPEPDMPRNRLNDAGIAPDGSLFFGSMDDDEKAATGSFYRWSADGLSRFGEKAVVTNGPTVDGVRGIVYTADTTAGRVFRQPLLPDGAPGPREDFVAFRPGDGHPDGITVDHDGFVWICHFGGARITRFSPDGEAVLVVPMPTAQVTKVAFGGPDLDRIYVTTSARRRDPVLDPMAGHLFVFEAGIRGLPADFCRMAP